MTATASVLDRAWRLAPQVSVRPERFGALLYDFDTRRLSFLKDLVAALTIAIDSHMRSRFALVQISATPDPTGDARSNANPAG